MVASSVPSWFARVKLWADAEPNSGRHYDHKKSTTTKKLRNDFNPESRQHGSLRVMAMIYIEVCYSRTDSKSHWLLSNDPARQLMSVDGCGVYIFLFYTACAEPLGRF